MDARAVLILGAFPDPRAESHGTSGNLLLSEGGAVIKTPKLINWAILALSWQLCAPFLQLREESWNHGMGWGGEGP